MRRAEKYIPHYTYHEWLHWEERGELIKGIPIPKATRVGPKHEKAISAIKTAFTSAIEKAACKGCYVAEPIDYKVTNETILRPDVFVLCNKINKTYLDFPPLIVVEVVSKASEERDRGIKTELYAQHGVKYYFIADAMKKSIELFKFEDGKYEVTNFESQVELELNDGCKIVVELETIW